MSLTKFHSDSQVNLEHFFSLIPHEKKVCLAHSRTSEICYATNNLFSLILLLFSLVSLFSDIFCVTKDRSYNTIIRNHCQNRTNF